MKKSTQKSREELFAEIAEEMGAERVVDLLKDILPSLLHTLMQQGKLDPDKLDDTLYVWTVVRNNEDAVKNLRASWRVDEDFMKSAQEAIVAERYAVAVVLIAIVIEHRINMFYRDVLENEANLSSETVKEILRSNMNTKLGWLLPLSTKKDLPIELRRSIRQIIDWRNAFIHYKAEMTLLDDLADHPYMSLVQQAKDFGLENIMKIPDQLEEALNDIMYELWPLSNAVENTIEAMFSHVKDKIQ